MITAIITLPGTFATDITGYVSQLFTDLSGYITLIIGVTLGVLVISAVVGMLKK